MDQCLKIEKANPSHAESIMAIWNPIIRETVWTFNGIEKSINDVENMILKREQMGFLSVVCISSGKVIGFASYSQFRMGTGYFKTMEHTVLVDKNSRGSGVGKKLVASLEEYAISNGVFSFIACVSEGNSAGIAFHENIGFRKICVLPNVGFKFEKFLNLVLLQKNLTT